MAKIYDKLIVDVQQEVRSIITVTQRDTNSRYLDVYLKDNGLAIDVTGHQVRIYGKKADGKEFYNDGEITEAENGRCQFPLTSEALAVANDLTVQLILYRDNVEMLHSRPFTIHVKKSFLTEGAVESSNEYGALVVLYQNLHEAYELMMTMVENIGAPGVIAEGLSIDTMWEAWEYMSSYLKVELTEMLQNAMDNNSVDGVVRKIGDAGDTGGSQTTGTVMGKSNKILNMLDGINKETQFQTTLGQLKYVEHITTAQALRSTGGKVRFNGKKDVILLGAGAGGSVTLSNFSINIDGDIFLYDLDGISPTSTGSAIQYSPRRTVIAEHVQGVMNIALETSKLTPELITKNGSNLTFHCESFFEVIVCPVESSNNYHCKIYAFYK